MANAASERTSEAQGHTFIVRFPGRGVIEVTDPLIIDLLLNEKIDISTAVVLHDRFAADETARVAAAELRKQDAATLWTLCGVLELDTKDLLEPRVRQLAETDKRLSPVVRGILPTLAALNPEEVRGLHRFLKGEPPSYSTGIHECLTVGYGRLDDYGFWEHPLPAVFVARAEKNYKDYLRVGKLSYELDAVTRFLERVQLWADTDFATWTANLGVRIRITSNDTFRKRSAEVSAALTQCREALKARP